MKKQTLTVIDGETLMDARLAPTKFCVDTLLPQGLSILAGAPKLGKSWLVLDLCVKVAKGENFLGQKTHKGTALYLCLEDSLRRIQERLCNITDDVPGNVFFATQAGTMAEGLEEQIRDFAGAHPDLTLVVIDTFQLIRRTDTEVSYANDYEEVRAVKRLADSLGIAILLVHHLRKMGDSDPLNKISGSTGISGATDAVFILDKSRRSADTATLCCTGRDIPYLFFSKRKGKTIETKSKIINYQGVKMRVRNKTIPFRVTEKELEIIDKKAAKAKLSRTDFLIAAALGKEITLLEDLKPILYELRRIGNNVNQLTKLANMGSIETVNLEEFTEMLGQLHVALMQIALSGKENHHAGSDADQV